MVKKFLSGPAEMGTSTIVARAFDGASVDIIANESDFEGEVCTHGSSQIYLVPLFWTTSGVDIVKRLLKRGCDTSTCVLILPRSMILADSWTRESLPVPGFVLPDEATALINYLKDLCTKP